MGEVFLALYSPSGRVEPRRGEGFFGARFDCGFASGSRTFCVLKALPARSSRPSRREGDEGCVPRNLLSLWESRA
jgi:hypothetical protein